MSESWPRVLSTGLSLLAVVAAVLVVLTAVRQRNSPGSQLVARDRARTRRVGSALRRGRPVDDVDRPLAQALVDGTRMTLQLSALLLVLSALMLTSAVTRPGSVPWLSGAAAALALAACLLGVLTTTRIRRGGAEMGLRPGGGDA